MSNVPPENSQIVVKDDAPGQSSRRSQRIRRAIVVSVVAHVIGVISLLYWYTPAANPQLTKDSPSTTDPSSDREPRNPPPPAVTPNAPRGDDVPKSEIQKSLEAQIEAVKQIPDDQKLDQLEKNIKRLESVSNPKAVNDIAAKITSSLGLDSEQYSAKKPEDVLPGKIDLSKAQLADVTRTRNPDGGWDYVSTLVDDSGREMQVPVTEAEGEAMYEAFQQMKKFPMAAGLYRKVVMPMLQKMVEAQSSK